MNRKTFFLLASLLLCLSGCTKNQYKSDVTDSFKEWTFFEKGSYWVYLNEGNSVYDTCRIFEKEKIYYNPDSPPQYEYIYLNISSKFIKKYLIYRDKSENSLLNLGINDYYASSDVLSELVAKGYSEEVSKTCRLVQIHTSLTINGNTFSNVVQTRDSSTSNTGTTILTDYYFVRNIGLVKWERKDSISDAIWSLVLWHTVQ